MEDESSLVNKALCQEADNLVVLRACIETGENTLSALQYDHSKIITKKSLKARTCLN